MQNLLSSKIPRYCLLPQEGGIADQTISHDGGMAGYYAFGVPWDYFASGKTDS